jgi:hypothetical protein
LRPVGRKSSAAIPLFGPNLLVVAGDGGGTSTGGASPAISGLTEDVKAGSHIRFSTLSPKFCHGNIAHRDRTAWHNMRTPLNRGQNRVGSHPAVPVDGQRRDLADAVAAPDEIGDRTVVKVAPAAREGLGRGSLS